MRSSAKWKRPKAGPSAESLGLDLAWGITNSAVSENRENFGILGLDLTRILKTSVFSGWRITPAVYHNYEKPSGQDQTTFGFDVNPNLFSNSLRIGLGARDVINDAGDTLFLTIGIDLIYK